MNTMYLLFYYYIYYYKKYYTKKITATQSRFLWNCFVLMKGDRYKEFKIL